MHSLYTIKIIFISFIGASDFCFDYSYWNDTNKCYNGTDSDEYTHARLCSAYDKNKSIAELGNDCVNSKSDFKYCPNSSNKTECKDPNFYCNISKSCIKDNDKCDGIKHCIFGEDEAIETCDSTFPESATVKCVELNRPLDDFWIKAVRCNGIKECKNGEDEPEECKGFKVSTSYFHFKDTNRKIKKQCSI